MFTYLEQWSKRPFSSDNDWKGWAMTIIFIFIVAGAWASVINLLKRAI